MPARSIYSLLVTALALMLLLINASLAQTSEAVQLTPGFTKLIRFDRPIATIVIGNPEVADARAQTDRSIALVGKSVGITNLIALDNAGAEVFSSLVVVGAHDAGKVIINSRRRLHEYWAYRCTADNCVRVEDRLEYLQPPAPIVVAPVAPEAQAPQSTDRADGHSTVADSGFSWDRPPRRPVDYPAEQ